MVKNYEIEGRFKIYELEGSLLFASIHNFLKLFSPETDPYDVIIEFHQSRVVDQSGLEALMTLFNRWKG